MCACENDELYRHETDGPDWDDEDEDYEDDEDDWDDDVCYPEEFDPLHQRN